MLLSINWLVLNVIAVWTNIDGTRQFEWRSRESERWVAQHVYDKDNNRRRLFLPFHSSTPSPNQVDNISYDTIGNSVSTTEISENDVQKIKKNVCYNPIFLHVETAE